MTTAQAEKRTRACEVMPDASGQFNRFVWFVLSNPVLRQHEEQPNDRGADRNQKVGEVINSGRREGTTFVVRQHDQTRVPKDDGERSNDAETIEATQPTGAARRGA